MARHRREQLDKPKPQVGTRIDRAALRVVIVAEEAIVAHSSPEMTIDLNGRFREMEVRKLAPVVQAAAARRGLHTTVDDKGRVTFFKVGHSSSAPR